MWALEKGIKCIPACGKSYIDVQLHLVHNCKGVSNTTAGFWLSVGNWHGWHKNYWLEDGGLKPAALSRWLVMGLSTFLHVDWLLLEKIVPFLSANVSKPVFASLWFSWYGVVCLPTAIMRDVFIGTVYMDISNIHSLIMCDCGITNGEYSKIMQFTAWFYFCIPVANSK